MYVSNKLTGLCTQINEPDCECNSVLWIKVSNYFILGGVYMPTDNSDYHDNDQYGDLTIDMFSIKAKYDLPIMLIGDFNGRTGTLNDIMLLETYDQSYIENYIMYKDILDTFHSLNVPVNRTNMDS